MNQNDSTPTLQLLEKLKALMPEIWGQAEVVGQWLWLEFNTPPLRNVRTKLKQLGFHWNRDRGCWQQPRGVYPVVPAAALEFNEAADWRYPMNNVPEQGELFALIWRPARHPLRLRPNDVIRIDGRLCRVIRVTDCAAVVVMNRPARVFSTRFDKPVRFQPSPLKFRISANSEIEILNRKVPGQKRRKQRRPPSGRRAANTNGLRKSRSAMPSPERKLA